MSLFGYTTPDVFNYHQKENDIPLVFTTSIIKNMEMTQETKDKAIGYPKVSIQQLPNTFNEATINDIAKQCDPITHLFNGYYNGLSDNKVDHVFGRETYIPQSYPAHYYNNNTFSPFYLAEVRRKPDDQYE